jgi:hypothetical protein
MNCKWDIESELTEAPDGRYLITTEMFDYRKEQSPDYVFETWTSPVVVTVENGVINKQEALKAADDLLAQCGYWGTFLEELEYKGGTTLTASFGS